MALYISRAIELWLTPDDPCLTVDPINALHSSQGFFLPYLVAAFLSNLAHDWPLHDLWPQKCIAFWSRVLPTKSGSHRAFLGNLTSAWPRLTPTLHDLWPHQYTTLWSMVLPSKFGGHMAFLSTLIPGWPHVTPAWPLSPGMHYTSVRAFPSNLTSGCPLTFGEVASIICSQTSVAVPHPKSSLSPLQYLKARLNA